LCQIKNSSQADKPASGQALKTAASDLKPRTSNAEGWQADKPASGQALKTAASDLKPRTSNAEGWRANRQKRRDQRK
jgi:hypothetical protein